MVCWDCAWAQQGVVVRKYNRTYTAQASYNFKLVCMEFFQARNQMFFVVNVVFHEFVKANVKFSFDRVNRVLNNHNVFDVLRQESV